MFGWAFLHNKSLHNTMPVLPTTYHKRITLPAVLPLVNQIIEVFD